MASSPWPCTAGDAPTQPAGAAATPTTAAPRSEQHLVKEGGNVIAAAVPEEEEEEEEEAKPHLPRDDDSEVVIQEHEQKINRYQAILAARLKAKFFSKKAFDGGKHAVLSGFRALPLNEHVVYFSQKYVEYTSKMSERNIYEAAIIVEGGTIQSSMWPCTRSFANLEFFSRDKNSHEKGNYPSSAADSSAKNSSPPLASDVSPKNNASALATENNPMPGKRQQSRKT